MKEIRLQRLQQLLDEHGGLKVELAKTLHKKPAQISQWFTHRRTLSEDTARELETRLKKPRGWFDTLSDVPSAPLPAHISERLAVYDIWPFPRIDERLFRRLDSAQIRDIETGMLAVAAQLGVRIAKRAAA